MPFGAALQLWMMTLRASLFDIGSVCGNVDSTVSPPTALGRAGAGVFASLLVQTLQSIAAFFLALHPSRARVPQYVTVW